jgi:membrane protein YqaA with SNARE-associated domain
VPNIGLILFASPWAHLIFRFFRRLGPLGLFLLGTLDSSFLFLPFGNDLLLIALISATPNGFMRVVYVAMSTAGSLLGVLIVDSLLRNAGERGLRRFMKRERIEQLKYRIQEKTGWFLFFATLLPPPFPFTAVVMTAAALQVRRKKLLGIVFLGRTVRFSLEAILAIYFGRKLIRYMDSDVVEYLVYAFIVIAVVGSTFSVVRWLSSEKRTVRTSSS